MIKLEGPFFEDLCLGEEFASAPAVTLDEGLAAVHHSILGSRVPISLSSQASVNVTGAARVVSPSLVWDLSIGQSTLATREVVANLFYRGLQFHRYPVLGDTLSSRAVVVGLKPNRPKAGRPSTGNVTLRIQTRDHEGRLVLDYLRCAMILAREKYAEYEERLSDLADVEPGPDPTRGWTLVDGTSVEPGFSITSDADVVTSAPELARLTLNVARVHHDDRPSGSRLVYGGHTIGLTLAQAYRSVPGLIVPMSWNSCSHISPVREGDTLFSNHCVLSVEAHESGGAVCVVKSRTFVHRSDSLGPIPVLDWTWTARVAAEGSVARSPSERGLMIPSNCRSGR